jgi:hypothetical protein
MPERVATTENGYKSFLIGLGSDGSGRSGVRDRGLDKIALQRADGTAKFLHALCRSLAHRPQRFRVRWTVRKVY